MRDNTGGGVVMELRGSWSFYGLILDCLFLECSYVNARIAKWMEHVQDCIKEVSIQHICMQEFYCFCALK